MTTCIFHSHCVDGFGAAWVVRKALGKGVNFIPAKYGDAPPDLRGESVAIVDFSYPRDTLIGIAAEANDILILDHHKTAEADLDGLQIDNLQVEFDMERSGAMLAWDYYFPNDPAPRLLKHIQDRDLWRFALDGTREIQSALFSYPYDFNIWDNLMAVNPDDMFREGRAIDRYARKNINELLPQVTRTMRIGGCLVPVANLPYMMASDAGHILAQQAPFAATYMDTPNGRVFSLRSATEGLDVSDIAKLYGGGGHAHAAGFTVSYDQAATFEV
jgi:oligoribonuclease NrnB/cAMP/cGMP phosphodiesterase (DHH superfamily)